MPIDDVSDIRDMYDGAADQEHARLVQHQLEYDLTWCYLNSFLPPVGHVLEIGAATGRYTLQLRRRGYSVTAVDLSGVLLEECRKNLTAEHLGKDVQFLTADARDLGALSGQIFDAVLLLGPLYHLIYEDDRKEALRQAIRLLHRGGPLFSAFISRVGVLGELMKRTPLWIQHEEEVDSLLASGKRPDDQPKVGFRGYYARVSELRPLHEDLGIETLAVAGVEPAISAEDEIYNQLEGPVAGTLARLAVQS